MLQTLGDPALGSWAIEAKTSALGVYVAFIIDGTRRDEWTKPFCSFGDNGATCTLGSSGVGSHVVEVQLRDANTDSKIETKTQTVVEGGIPPPLPTSTPGIATPTSVPTVPTATPTASSTSTPGASPTASPTVPIGAPTPPELPRAVPNVSLPVPSGIIRTVAAGGPLQATLDAAQPGDVVELAAGATWNGNFVLRPKAQSTLRALGVAVGLASPLQVWIRSSQWQALPPQGNRVSPSDASKMAKIVGQGNDSAIRWEFGASNWYLSGLELTNNNTGTTYTNYSIATIGMDNAGGSPPTAADLPDNVVLDRVYIHGNATGNTRRGVTFNGGSFAIVDSHIEDIHEVGADNQALGTWTARGPVLVRNNYLNSCGEVFMSGGADTKIQNLVPSDFTIVANTIEWKASWKSASWSCKNLSELKNARRVLFDGNTYRNWWPSGQTWAFAWTVRNQSGTNPWAEVNDITFRNNHISAIENGANFLAHDSPGSGGGVSTRMSRFAWTNNLIEMTTGTALQFLAGAQDVSVTHNTWIQPVNSGSVNLSGSPAGNPAESEKMVRFRMTDNIFYIGKYCVTGDNDGVCSAALNLYAPGAVFTTNAMYDGVPPTGVAAYQFAPHPGNFFPSSISAVGFVDLNGKNYQLAPSSAYKGKATDGKDVGVMNWGLIP